MNLSSIKTRAMLLLFIILVIPVIIVGLISAVYFRDVIRSDIWNENIDQAKIIASFTANYVNSSQLYLESQASRPSVFEAVNQSNIVFLTDTIMHIQNSSIFNAIYVANCSGIVISSFPANITGRNDSGKPWVIKVVRNNRAYVSDGTRSPVTGKPVVYVSAPIVNNSTTIGALVGTLDLEYYAKFLAGSRTNKTEYTYIVNRTGHVMAHTNSSYMYVMLNVSDRPGVQNVLKGETGVVEQYNVQERMYKLASYAPVEPYGWGVVVSLPIYVVYAPIYNAIQWFFVMIISLILLAIALASLVSASLVKPILEMAAATRKMPCEGYTQHLPLGRKDELGALARSYDQMAKKICRDQELITAARDSAEEEKNRAELYVDIMGHDINNLNQVTLTNLEFLADDPGLTDEDRKMLDHAINSVRGSAEIIENVHKIQRITGETLEVESVDLNDMILRCIQEAPRPGGKVVHVNYREHPGMFVRAVPLLKELFCNLISNAVKYSGQEVTIDIDPGEKIENGRKEYVISVADNGNGIPDDVKPRLFRRFARGTTKAHGKGLGLYIVKMLAERFGGSVKVEDRVPGDYGKGAKFVVTLPAAPGK
jgi:two-component system, sensor histidine kinase